ncbi:enoyl-CoA hydratase-related protein [Yinghuangia sp. ASG 101]|uniref:enoyl-CoA hydratase-related protein n=1 Tax=Yinghuangia sp. ASG 101 TaxID=2896848 RepID=UPI001E3E9573|nr:enoyl-CoA hydratase-related protein [Yinghuangia sp. ASG 101]UGQ11113.1 enoyl-CoA hydratase-related protein [Yinghuangia sp. ASG 101]
MPDFVRVATRGPVLLVTLDRPAKRNAVNAEMTLALDAAFDRLDGDPALRVGVLAAEGPYFCAGTDLRTGAGPHTARGGMYGVIRRRRHKPLVAAVAGPALGGGFELVLVADLVVASRDAWFALPETTRGRVPAGGGLFRAPDRLPRNIAVELMLTAGRLEAERAHHLGLVNRLTEPNDVLAEALDLALATCGGAPEAVAELFTALHASSAADDAAGWAATHTARTTLLASDDRTEGNAAFVERRAPRWVPDDDVRKEVLG